MNPMEDKTHLKQLDLGRNLRLLHATHPLDLPDDGVLGRLVLRLPLHADQLKSGPRFKARARKNCYRSAATDAEEINIATSAFIVKKRTLRNNFKAIIVSSYLYSVSK